jgi:hypothetical protein
VSGALPTVAVMLRCRFESTDDLDYGKQPGGEKDRERRHDGSKRRRTACRRGAPHSYRSGQLCTSGTRGMWKPVASNWSRSMSKTHLLAMASVDGLSSSA